MSRAPSLHATLTSKDYFLGHKRATLDLIQGKRTLLKQVKTYDKGAENSKSLIQ